MVNQAESNDPELVEGPMKNSWYVYICETETGRFYTGIAKNPKTRLLAHNNLAGAKLAKDQGPFRLVYISGRYPTKSDARSREIQIKGWTRAKKQKLISGEWV